jgi:hypothetical protein
MFHLASTQRLKWLSCAAAAALLSACTPTVSDDILTSNLSDKQQAVAIITASLEGASCSHIGIQLARKTADGFEPTTNVQVETGLLSLSRLVVGDIPQVALPAGQHHIVSYACREANRITTVGQKHGKTFGFGGSYVKSFAHFDLAPGEIVNIGHLRITPVGIYGAVTFGAQDQPEAVMTKLKESKPKLFAQMKTRLMTVPAAQTPEELRKAMCDLLASLNKPGSTTPPPASCLPPVTSAPPTAKVPVATAPKKTSG